MSEKPRSAGPTIRSTRGGDLLARLKRERMRLFLLIEPTPWLDWLLLTKRPQYFAAQMPEWWRRGLTNDGGLRWAAV